ncbi:MAG: hypothetical protein ABSA05_08460 [Opitutaceae bacterium]|jgi:hypothetical protein
MSTSAATVPSALPAAPDATSAAARAIGIGIAGTAATALGFLISPARVVATGWLVGVCFWTAMAIGFLLLVLIHHIFDAMWSTVLRRQLEHGLAAFKWLALLFLPLVIASWIGPRDIVWPWMNPAHIIPGVGKTVGTDLDYAKKSAFLNLDAFTVWSAVFFGIWIWLSARLRRASFAQDSDGDPKWTVKNRFTSGMGIPLTALTLTFASIYWIKSLEYHWYSTMYGVWFFSNCMRGAYSLGVLIMLWLWNRGDYKGVLTQDHWHSIGKMMLTFTVFWGYIAFSQYFLIWNANVPEETFWYNLREYGDWWGVGMVLVFGHFLVPFLALLSYRYKVTRGPISRIALWILAVIFVDFCWNILPAIKDVQGRPVPFFSLGLLWAVTATIGVGGVCVWAYLRSFATARLIPIRDPRIAESLMHHE